MSRRITTVGLQVATLVTFLAIWELLTRTRVINPFLLASPSDIGRLIVDWFAGGAIWGDIGATMLTLSVGYVSGVVGGVVIGMLAGRIAFFRYYFDVFIIFLNSLPRLVLIPFFIILFGFGNVPGMIVTGLIVIFLVALNTRAAVEGIQGDLVLHARMLGANPLQLLNSVYVPGVALSVLSSARLSIGLGFQAAVVAQFFGSTGGLGFLIAEGQQSYNPTQIYAGIVVASFLAYLMDIVLGVVNKRTSRWLPVRS